MTNNNAFFHAHHAPDTAKADSEAKPEAKPETKPQAGKDKKQDQKKQDAKTGAKQRITPRALLEIKRLSDPQVHPDGQRVAFVVTEADFDESRYVSHLWLTEHFAPETAEDTQEEQGKEAAGSAASPLTPDISPRDRNKPDNAATISGEAEKADDSDEEDAGEEHDPTRQLTFSGDGESQPRWSPDGRYLAFLSSRLDETETAPDGEDDEPTDQVWILPIDGGEARKLTSAREGVLDYAWIPGSNAVAFLAPEPRPRPLEALRKEQQNRHKVDAIVEQDDRLRRQIWRVDADDRKPKLLFTGDYGVLEFAFSPDGERVAFITNYSGEGNDYHLADLYVHHIAAGKTVKLIARAGGKYHLRWSPDGAQIAFLSWYDPALSYSRECVFVADAPAELPAETAQVYGVDASGLTDCRMLTDLDYDIGIFEWAHVPEEDEAEEAEEAQASPREATKPDTSAADAAPAPLAGFALAAVRTGSEIYRIADNAATPVEMKEAVEAEAVKEAQTIKEVEAAKTEEKASPAALVERHDLSRDPGSDALVYVQESAASLPEIFLRDADGHVHQLTKLNAEFADTYELPHQEVIVWNSPDGTLVEGLLTYPAENEERGMMNDESEPNSSFIIHHSSFPLIVQIHGGPKGRASNTLQNYSMAPVWAVEGYAVLRPNFRGSEGYGNAFAVANRRDLGGGDFADIMAGVEHVIGMGVADPDKMGVMGGSYGGYMTNWAIGHTDRFQAAISMFGIFHLQTDYSNSELSRWDNEYMGAYYWEDPEIYRRLSPGSYIEAIKTPTLIIHGEEDTNTFISNSKELYQALRHRGVTTQFVHYPREGHGLREPNHKLDEMRRCLAWMDKYVRQAGQNLAAYRVGDKVPNPSEQLEMIVTRAEISAFLGQPKPAPNTQKTQASGTELLEVALTLHHLDTRQPAAPLTLAANDLRLDSVTTAGDPTTRADSETVPALSPGRPLADTPPLPLLPVGIPLDAPGGKVLVEGENLRTTQQPDAETGQLAFGWAVVFRVPRQASEGLLRVADFPPVKVQWAADEDEDEEERE